MGCCDGDSQAPFIWWNLGPENLIPDPKMSTRDRSHPSSANQNKDTLNPRRLFTLNKNQKKHVDNAVDLWYLAQSTVKLLTLTAKFLSVRQFLWVSVLLVGISTTEIRWKSLKVSLFYLSFIIKKKSPPLCAAVSHCCNPSDVAIGWKPKMKSVLLTADRQPRWTLSLITGMRLLIGVLWPFQLSFT